MHGYVYDDGDLPVSDRLHLMPLHPLCTLHCCRRYNMGFLIMLEPSVPAKIVPWAVWAAMGEGHDLVAGFSDALIL